MKGNVYIGIAGWSYADWKSIVYPRASTDQLEYVSRFVDVIEINNTFYRPPEEKICRSWMSKTAGLPEFYFTAKLHRDFTHEGKIDNEMVRQFHDGFEPMLEMGKLKHLLMQFKFDFEDTAENRNHLKKLTGLFKDFDTVVEVRHKSWQQEESLRFFDDMGVSVCNLDYPCSSTGFDKELCTVGRHGYFRLHGRNAEKWFAKGAGRDEVYDYYYSDNELEHIKKRIEKLAQVFERLTVIANNHYRGKELANALELKWLISEQPQQVPQGLLKEYPQLARIAAKTNLFM